MREWVLISALAFGLVSDTNFGGIQDACRLMSREDGEVPSSLRLPCRDGTRALVLDPPTFIGRVSSERLRRATSSPDASHDRVELGGQGLCSVSAERVSKPSGPPRPACGELRNPYVSRSGTPGPSDGQTYPALHAWTPYPIRSATRVRKPRVVCGAGSILATSPGVRGEGNWPGLDARLVVAPLLTGVAQLAPVARARDALGARGPRIAPPRISAPPRL